MELPTYLLIIGVVIVLLYLLFYSLFSGLRTEKSYFRVILAGLIACVAGVIIASLLLPQVTYNYCVPLGVTIPKLDFSGLSFGPYDISLVSCNTVMDTVIKIAAVMIVVLIGLLIAESIANLI